MDTELVTEVEEPKKSKKKAIKGASTPSKPTKKKPKKVDDPVIFDKIDCQLFLTDDKPSTFADVIPMNMELAKELLGWEEETKEAKFGDDCPAEFTDRYGKRIRCLKNIKNRYYEHRLAESWMYEMLRRKWKFVGESIVFDKQGYQHEGRHRLVGLVLANQEWEIDSKRPKDEQLWQGYWKEPPVIDCLVVMGIDAEDADVHGTGKPRSSEDVLYRSDWLNNINPPHVRQKYAKALTKAAKFLWDRTAQQISAEERYGEGFKLSHSELKDFIANHPKLVAATKFIMEENDGKEAPEGLVQYLNLGYCAGLLYLMGCSTTDPSDATNPKRYDVVLTEKALDWKHWDTAQEFWVDLCNNSANLEGLTSNLIEYAKDPLLTVGYRTNLTMMAIIKAWNLYSDGKKIKEADCKVEEDTNELGQRSIIEHSLVGGIDTGTTKTE
jgi:hypothetical protein